MEIKPIAAFTDNLIWMLIAQDETWVVDPGDAKPVIDELDRLGRPLSGILLTHHHNDHTGGVAALKRKYGCASFGPRNISDNEAKAGDVVRAAKQELQALAVPYHTMDHIAFYAPGVLFCGDALFSIGCGRIFEGQASDLLAAMNIFKSLPDNTQVFAAHEYTLSNIKFAKHVWPENAAKLQEYEAICHEKRQKGQWTLPSELAVEKELNPFLNADAFASKWGVSELEAISQLRSTKDGF